MTEFIEGVEKVVGELILDSGVIHIMDAINESDFAHSNKVVIDVETPGVSMDVIVTMQQGKRFLIIPLDGRVNKSLGVVSVTGMDEEAVVESE